MTELFTFVNTYAPLNPKLGNKLLIYNRKLCRFLWKDRASWLALMREAEALSGKCGIERLAKCADPDVKAPQPGPHQILNAAAAAARVA
jgi:hypothetical protein